MALFTTIISIVLLAEVYALFIGLYRLYWSPIKNIPGPKLAAASFWYEFYYDVILGGQYTFKIRKLHAKYGPIIRINPYEIHIDTPEFYDELYSSGNKRRNKWYWATKAFGADESTFATVLHDRHRMRRAALNQFFSKAQVRKLQPLIQERVDAVLQRFKDFRDNGQIIRLDIAFTAYSADVIMQYAFGRSERKVNAIDFDGDFHDVCVNGGKSSFLVKQFPIVLRITRALPPQLLQRFNPGLTSFIRMHRDIAVQVKEVMARPSTDKTSDTNPTIFQEILDSKLPPQEKTLSRLAQDSGAVVGAGTVTTAWAITIAVFHLISQAKTLHKLKCELAAAFPTQSEDVTLTSLEQLPYLSAVIKEGLRLSYGVSLRLQRISPDEVITYIDPATMKKWAIPAGTPVSMTSLLLFQNEKIFPEPLSFRPERWMENPRLDRYQVVFSKGTRICLGANLAMAEILLLLVGIFRLYGSKDVRFPGDVGVLELFETDKSDVECCIDGFVPLPKADSKGVRVRVRP